MDHLARALELAENGVGLASPNPMVGAVVVRNGQVVGSGFHTYSGVKHAEILALEEAGDLARGATLYVSLEPCSHHGRTAPCSEAVVSAGISKLVYPMDDPNPLVSGKGVEQLRNAGVEVVMDSRHTAAAKKLNEPFVHFMRTGRPFVTLKSAVTLDGKIAAPFLQMLHYLYNQFL